MGVIALGLLGFSALAIVAGRWQWSRHETRSAEVAAWAVAGDASPVPLSELVSEPTTDLPRGTEWRVATVTGVFDATSVTVLRNRAVDGVPGPQYLMWMVTDSGDALLVLTGWDAATSGPPAEGRIPPSQSVEATLLLRDQEPDDGKRGGGATRITPAQMPPVAHEVLPGYGLLVDPETQDGRVAEYGHLIPVVAPSYGPHLAYSIQWFMFSVMVPAGGVILARRRRDDATPALSRSARVSSGRTDEEIEDAL